MIQKTSFQNPVWQTPYLPAIPHKIPALKSPSYLLTDREKPEWQFLFAPISDAPSPYAQNQDYDFSKTDHQPWQNVVVPGSLIMQGFPIENNVEYYYKRTITVPSDFKGQRVFLRFEGVYSNARVWVNNHFLETHVGGFTVWDCDITAFATDEPITLVIGVADIEGKTKGLWNPQGKPASNSSWASHYAHHNIGGILRDITLFALPQSHIARTYVNTAPEANGNTWAISADMELHSSLRTLDVTAVLMEEDLTVLAQETHTLKSDYLASTPITAPAQVIQPDKKWARKYQASAKNDAKYSECFLASSQKITSRHNIYAAQISLNGLTPKLWDAEHPHLYLLKIILTVDGKEVQENLHLVGFRQISYGGLHGTEKNKVYINGKEIKLRGVCRHDVSHLYGRSLSKEAMKQEIMSYKRNNINHIRTSHYPACDYLLEVCDRLGIYVEQENAACFKGANSSGIYNPPQDFVNSFAEMIESSRNHPSIIIWSLANESGFEKTYAFRTEYNYVKVQDTTRPAIFSYPHTVHSKPLPYDIRSHHYQKVTGKLGDEAMPVLHDEFAHVACYNLKRLEKENSCREFWGESIKKGWDNIFATDGALGCAIWGGIDDLFYLPDGTAEKHQSHAKGKCAGYGPWGAILDGYHREKPEAWLTKKAFTPILLDEQKSLLAPDRLKLHLTNRFDHTCLTEVTMQCTDAQGTLFYEDAIQSPILPHESGFVEIAAPNSPWVKIQFYFGNEQVDTYKLFQPQYQEKVTVSAAHEPKKQPLQMTVVNTQKDTGILLKQGQEALARGACIRFDGKDDITTKLRLIKQSAQDLSATLVCSNHAKYRLELQTMQDETLVTLSPANTVALFLPADKLQLAFLLPQAVESVCWHRDALHSYYPEHHIGRAEGTAYLKRKNAAGDPDQYGKKPNWDWEADMADYFLFDEKAPQNHIVTNDFRTRRNCIHDYTVQFEDGRALSVTAKMKDLNAFVDCRQREGALITTLQIGLGNHYPDLAWGNYWGKQQKLRAWKITFTLSASDMGRK